MDLEAYRRRLKREEDCLRWDMASLLMWYRVATEDWLRQLETADVASPNWLEHPVRNSIHRAMRISRQTVRHPITSSSRPCIALFKIRDATGWS
ncbi:hypothetical protein Syun_012198 [Stephania yunnanensis]|uniref:Uncharacterized protein n=1 Tax=Stephania yunnanensis TaxID=152371 RepID=A0AAP0JYZ0_9MAGN